MTEHGRQIDETVQQLLKETYQSVRPSPAFKQRLFQQLVAEIRPRHRSSGWLERCRLSAAGLAEWGRSLSPRQAVSLILGFILFVLVVGSAVRAMQGRFGDVPATKAPTERQAPEPADTPTVPPVSPTPIAVQPVDRQATPISQERQLPTATPPMPVVLPITSTIMARPTVLPTAMLVPSPTAFPTATPIPPPPASPTVTPTSIPVKIVSPTVPPTATPTPCVVSRVVGIAWLDVNGDGKRDQDDRPLGGVVAVLTDESGQVIATVTTDADGRYSFESLPAGVYRLYVRPPAGYRAVSPEVWVLHLKCAAVEMDFGYQPEEQR